MLAMVGFITAVVFIYFGMQYYVAFWLIRHFPRLGLNANAVRIAVLLLSASFPLAVHSLRIFRGAWVGWFAYISFIWLGIVFIWLTCALLGDLSLVLAWLCGAVERARPVAAVGVLAATALLSLWAIFNASRMPKLTEVEIELPRLPQGLDGFTIVQLSDLHLGAVVPMEKFARIAERVAALKPDMIVLTGDISDAGLKKNAPAGAFLRAPHGVFAVMGNHEFYHGLEDSARVLQDMGARVLRNEVAAAPCGIQVIGVDDIRTARVSRPEVAELLRRLDPAKPSIFLSHQPLDFDLAAQAGVGLMLSGHTHEGQIWPFGLIVRLFYPHFHGLYKERASWLYVSAGTGQWGPPMRLFTRAEIVRIRLRAPKN